MSLLLLLLFLPLLSLIYLLPKIILNKSRFNPPGPLGLPLIGNLHQIEQSSLHTSLWNLSKSYGPIVSLRFGFIPVIVVSSASLAKEVMKTQDLIFCSRPSLVGQQKVSYHGLEVIFSPYNDYWKEMRKIFMLHLLGPKRVQSFRHIREDEVTTAMKKIHELALSSKEVNLSEMMKSVASTIMMRVGFGKTYQDGHDRTEVLHRLTEVQAMMADFFASDLWPGLPFVGLVDRLSGKTKRLDECFRYFDLFYQSLIDEHLKPENTKSREGEEDFVDILLRLKQDQLFNLTHDHIKAMLMDVLVAGTDTSSATVVWAMTALIKNPKVMKKVQEEVRNVVGKKSKVDEDDLPKLIYMKAVVKEIWRLYPTVPLLVPRETTKETTLNGYKIKQKTLVFINTLAIGRDPKSWDSPEEFLPERFLGSDIDFKGNDFELTPFGAGRRICPGMTMGVVTVDLLLANLLYLFDWSLPDGIKKEDIDLEVMPGITMHKRNELCLLPHVYL
ncbi:putative cytochrome P450 [Helianthus annuus]|uniref:Cytochrome P450 n=1 Tax=Helianthus annuus TaxID=4232 RepID=A0A251U0A7_HELAN|nr:cytochrome P450 83B1 isoform X2 [Helianthus annuus]KAF5792567.1 putative cytochrome P450 [Helianthus annuus]KAJ0527500.1 putative cytochrome P450 [Helianthus annuus]KAJ0536232.1 putative cytochrome P450 [Helianthus annuus]KAJ0543909.1 putative cytochrome P450 [Helianthus annuus]KAJ0708963.1 putative cytochrome P450 [Helianthus annuus]